MEIRHANFHRAAALGGIDRGNIDPDDSEVVELHRRHLSNCNRHLGTGANVKRLLTAQTQRRSRKVRTAKATFAERGTCQC